MHITELQIKLQQNRNESRLVSSKYRLRTAQADDAHKMLEEGWDVETTAKTLGVPIGLVEAERARIERYNEMKRKYLASGRLEVPGEMAHFTIYQR